MIKHRAKYIEKLLGDQVMLQEERDKAEWKRKHQIKSSLESEDIASTSVGLKQSNIGKMEYEHKNDVGEEATCH